MTSAIATLSNIYHRRIPPVGLPVIGLTSNTVPWELIRAAGFQPFLLSPLKNATPLADRYMEDVFTARLKAVFDFLLSRDAEALKAVVIPRTSEQEHKLYLYLREVARQGLEHSPRPILYNLLHSRSAEARAYGLERTRDLRIQLEQLSGRAIGEEALRTAIEEGNAARRAIRVLLQLRAGPRPKLSGSEALALIGACYFMDRSEYAKLAWEAAEEIDARDSLQGPRILIHGTPQDNLDFCTAVEAQGAVVVAEDDWWCSRAAGRDIEINNDPLQAIFEKYYLDAISPRVFPAASDDDWFLHAASTVDGVIFYLPPDDDVLGWDYPRLRAHLDEHSIPHRQFRGAATEELGEFVEGLVHA
ncbi:MAG TPA: 2-hydroxyacyl-CoA dehydratase family protein [Bryobacteraceae bacterium]|nr:2-hydroxyacyl-CoA dehydratase family protein [Bryobacteraceae bacterium]